MPNLVYRRSAKPYRPSFELEDDPLHLLKLGLSCLALCGLLLYLLFGKVAN